MKKLIFCIINGLLLLSCGGRPLPPGGGKEPGSGYKLRPIQAQEMPPAKKTLASIPSDRYIMSDLVGHTLSEGLTEGYHKEGWTYVIENESISNFEITEILAEDANDYIVVAKFNLAGGENYYYRTTARISYMNKGDGWEFNYVFSLGMQVVSDGQYDDFINTEIIEDGWGGTYCLNIRNLGECTLIVGGEIYTNKWMKFNTIVDPHSASTVGGVFFGGSVKDYEIHFVLRQ